MTRKYSVRPLSAIFIANLFTGITLAQQLPASAGIAAPSPIDSIHEGPFRTSEVPAGLPRVICDKNQLSISADNATLRSVLISLQACLGIKIDVPATLREERSYIHLGPAPARTVLQDLLGSTDMDYALQPSDVDPERLNAILLMPHLPESSPTKASNDAPNQGGTIMSPARRAWLEARDSSGRGTSPRTEDDAQPQEAVPVASPVAEKTAGDSVSAADTKVGAESDSASQVHDTVKADAGSNADAKPDSAMDNSVTPAVNPVVAPTADSVSAPATATIPADGSSASPEESVLQKKINDMQQLFEERKKLNANPGGTPNSTTPPS